jgi:hypothetical protein
MAEHASLVGNGLVEFEVDVDPERPYAWHYEDLNYVRWYACMVTSERFKYLDWIISKRRIELDAWHAGYIGRLSRFMSTPVHDKLRSVERQRRIELTDLEPLPDYWPPLDTPEGRRRYRDTSRWERKVLRKRVSVGGRCEYPDCDALVDDCHHLHYWTIGFEENCDLEALCHRHHEARHGTRF